MPLEIRGAHFLIRSAQLVRRTRLEYRHWRPVCVIDARNVSQLY